MEFYPVSTSIINHPVFSYDYPAYCPALRRSLDITNSIVPSVAHSLDNAFIHLLRKVGSFNGEPIRGEPIRERIYSATFLGAVFVKKIYDQKKEIAAGLSSFLATAFFATNWFRTAPSQIRQHPLRVIVQITRGVFSVPLTVASLVYNTLKFGLSVPVETVKMSIFALSTLRSSFFHPLIATGASTYLGLNILDFTRCEGYTKDLKLAELQSIYKSYVKGLSPKKRIAHEKVVADRLERLTKGDKNFKMTASDLHRVIFSDQKFSYYYLDHSKKQIHKFN